jgi:hypothetical protein
MNINYQEDIPNDNPQFDFNLIAKALSKLLQQPSQGAIVLGIHGPWGSGKTTLMQALRREIEVSLPKDNAIFIDFNAWKFQDRQAIWRALILHLLEELRNCDGNKSKIEQLERSLYQAFSFEEKGPWRLNWRTLIVEGIGMFLSVLKLDFIAKAIKSSTGWFGRIFFRNEKDDKGNKKNNKDIIDQERVDKLASVLERTTIKRNILQVQSIEQFLEEFRKLVNEFREKKRQIFVFIDDLDRCLPESALEIFESIKLFLDAPGCSYVVALDREVIRKGLDVKYNRQGEAAQGQLFIDPDEYIEKTISVSFDIPRLSNKDIDKLIDSFKLPIKLNVQHKSLIKIGLGNNPRRIKRFMNTLAVQLYLAEVIKELGRDVYDILTSKEQSIMFDFFLKLLLISYRYSSLFALLYEDVGLLERLQKICNSFETEKEENYKTARYQRNKAIQEEVAIVQQIKNDETFWKLMAEIPNLGDNFKAVKKLLKWFRKL